VARWLEFLFSVAFFLATNIKKEILFDYDAEDDTMGRWFSCFSLLRTPFQRTEFRSDSLVLSKFFRL